ncbi:hypothetical protein HXX76_012602 [Chlamydomonas incerta]|uniref:Uncharacterized protein n=1 Tax=Chlamydomonas incerta TaxID=51695 RepID=A0A835VVW8_CHLIN|nr:hypothetical protein HXX76_012602 [Chlamydomonas incerta]|eukprot:KAG2427091.1 hypothetical protein HXX76_012602 [Chlamydomonas incerta]
MTELLKLSDRASHVFFLRKLASDTPAGASGPLGELATHQVVSTYVRPATASSKLNFVDCLRKGELAASLSPAAWCPGGVMTHAGAAVPAFGPTTYFLSHAWSYKFSELVALAEAHYAAQPDTDGGKAFAPIFYWVDILAVSQHFTGDFKEHPDSDFPGVIRASRAVLFTMHPWRCPVAPTRVWCLFEALTAVQSPGVGLEVLMDRGASRDTGAATLTALATSIDVRSAKATVASDRAYIMGCIEAGAGGVAGFNTVLRRALKSTLENAMVARCVLKRDSASLGELIKAGCCRDPDGSGRVDAAGWLKWLDAKQLAAWLDSVEGGGGSSCPCGLVLAGRHECWEHECLVADGKWSAKPTDSGAYIQWAFLPLDDSLCAAIARLLRRQSQQQPAGSSSVGGGVGGTRGAAAVKPAAASAARAVASPARRPAGTTATTAGKRSTGSSSSSSSSSKPAAAANGTGSSSGHGGGGGGSSGGSSGRLEQLWLTLGVPEGLHRYREVPDLLAKYLHGSSSGSSNGNEGGSSKRCWWDVLIDLEDGRLQIPELTPPGLGGSSSSCGGAGGARADACTAAGSNGSGGATGDAAGEGGERKPVAGRRAAVTATAAAPPKAGTAAARVGVGAGATPTAAAAAALPPGRSELWRAVGAPGCPLQLLCLHRCFLTAGDVAALRRALTSGSCRLKTLQVLEPEALDGGVLQVPQRYLGADVWLHTCDSLAAGLAAAALAAPSLERVHIMPTRTCFIEDLPGLPAAAAHLDGWSAPLLPATGGGAAGRPLKAAAAAPVAAAAAGGGGQCLKEFILAPVVLSPAATRQLAAALAALPALEGGGVDCKKAPPRGWTPGPLPEELVNAKLSPLSSPQHVLHPPPGAPPPRPRSWHLAARGWNDGPCGEERLGKCWMPHSHCVQSTHLYRQPPLQAGGGGGGGGGVLMPDLSVVLQVLARDEEARRPGDAGRAAALTHWLLAGAGPGAVPPSWGWLEYHTRPDWRAGRMQVSDDEGTSRQGPWPLAQPTTDLWDFSARGRDSAANARYRPGDEDGDVGVQAALAAAAAGYAALGEEALAASPPPYQQALAPSKGGSGGGGGLIPPARLRFDVHQAA